MKTTHRVRKILAALLAALVGLMVATSAAADVGRHYPARPAAGHPRPPVTVPVNRGYYWGPRYSVGVYLGPGFWYGPYYPWYYPRYPYYYPPYPYVPPVVTVPSSPPTYVEREVRGPEAEPAYWHFCRESNAYYPYVRECPGGWQRVSPLPPPAPER